MSWRPRLLLVATATLLGTAYACGAGSGADAPGSGSGGTSGGSGGPTSGGGTTPGTGGGTGGAVLVDAGQPDTGGEDITCAQAAQGRTYIGCSFWPTVTYNPVYTNFDFAAVVANGGGVDAEITVERAGALVTTATVPAGSVASVFLPWVNELKGPMFDLATTGSRVTSSVRVDGGAYHLTSTVPVTVWQFNPLQYEEPIGECAVTPNFTPLCLSVSNDAALLIPDTAMTGAYRVFGRSAANGGPDWGSTPGAFAITATADGTHVDVQLSAAVAAGAGVSAGVAGDVLSFDMNAGDVVQMLGAWGAFWDEPHADLSGSLVVADPPAAIQVIASNPLSNVPNELTGFADHMEETVLPAEVIGTEYLVAPPTSPDRGIAGHVVRFYGNVDGTTLSYPSGAQPVGAPTALSAGQVVEIGPLTDAFQVTGTQPFAVASFMLGGQVQDPTGTEAYTRGDPAFSMYVTPEQFRDQYTFLAPIDYTENYADIYAPDGTALTLDGLAVTEIGEPIGTSGWSVHRVHLGPGNNGAHELSSTLPVGLQVMGFGHATAYYYPGGLNLELISEPPPIVY